MRKLILKLTHKIWNREIARIICRCYSQNYISSQQMHEILSKFDPTQKHEVY